MTPQQLHNTFKTMQHFGGSFCKDLASAWFRGDRHNRARIERAFPDYLRDFGPDSPFYLESAND